MKGKFNWAIVISALLGFLVGLIVGWAVWAAPTPVEATQPTPPTCRTEGECNINESGMLCCEGFVCVDQGKPSDIGKCEVQENGCEIPEACTLPLYEKDGPPNWFVVSDGASGLVKYGYGGLSVTASGLKADTDYALIYAPDPWPQGLGDSQANGFGNGNTAFGAGTSDGSGNLTILGMSTLGYDIPHPNDVNYSTGAKIWLVLSADHDGTQMIGWTPASYLFEGFVIPGDDECWVKPEPSPEPEQPIEEEHHEAPMPSAPEHCVNVPTPENPANFHLYRKGEYAELKWLPTDGDTVNIYWKNPASGNWEHSLINSPNDGIEMIGGLGNFDWSFGLAQVNDECNQSDIIEVEDGNTPDWVLFR